MGYKHIGDGTLLAMNASEMKQALHTGTLPCRWSPDGAWVNIRQRAEAHETTRKQAGQEIHDMKQRQEYLQRRRQELQTELVEVIQESTALAQSIEQKKAQPSMRDLSALVEFATRMIPIEQELVAQLETELNKRKPKLAALNDNTSSQPKLSLMLNCMGIDATGIAATATLDLAQFARKTARPTFASSLRAVVKQSTMLDLLYCGELARECEFPFVSHEDKCPVCGNRTVDQLIQYLQERKINLPEKTLRENQIDGRRVLFCTEEDFSGHSADQVHAAIQALQSIHEEHL